MTERQRGSIERDGCPEMHIGTLSVLQDPDKLAMLAAIQDK
jgi:hypothetical protein